jgi:hypothetical protein
MCLRNDKLPIAKWNNLSEENLCKFGRARRPTCHSVASYGAAAPSLISHGYRKYLITQRGAHTLSKVSCLLPMAVRAQTGCRADYLFLQCSWRKYTAGVSPYPDPPQRSHFT